MNFEEIFLPHLDAAFNLARWLTRNEDDAQDVVQEAYLRALKSFGSFYGSDGRPWLLMIVRNTFYTWLKRNRSRELFEFDEAVHLEEIDPPDQERTLILNGEKKLLKEALEELPLEFREVLVMRELEELSYREIAAAAEIPLGTVMSRLARARQKLQLAMQVQMAGGPIPASSVNLRAGSKETECRC